MVQKPGELKSEIREKGTGIREYWGIINSVDTITENTRM